MEKARSGRTTIVVAQRLSTVRNADKILVLEDGRVEEEGTHAELLTKSGLYYNLIKRQSSTKMPERNESQGQMNNIYFGDDVEAVDTTNDGLSGRVNTPLSELVVPDDVIREIAEREKEDEPKMELMRVFKMNAPEWPFILLGSVSSVAMVSKHVVGQDHQEPPQGGVAPAFALLFGNVLEILSWFVRNNQKKIL